MTNFTQVISSRQPVYILGLKQLAGDQCIIQPSEKQKYLLINKIARCQNDFGYFGHRDIIFIPESLKVGQIIFRLYTQTVEFDGDRVPTRKGDITVYIDQIECDLLSEIIVNLKALPEDITEFNHLEVGYEIFESFFTFLANHFDIKI